MATYCTCTPVQGYRGNIHAKSTQTSQWIPCCTGSQNWGLSMYTHTPAFKKKTEKCTISLYDSTCVQIHLHKRTHTYPPILVDTLGGGSVGENILSYLCVWIQEPFTPELTLQPLPLPRAPRQIACNTYTHTPTHTHTHTHTQSHNLSLTLSVFHTYRHTYTNIDYGSNNDVK